MSRPSVLLDIAVGALGVAAGRALRRRLTRRRPEPRPAPGRPVVGRPRIVLPAADAHGRVAGDSAAARGALCERELRRGTTLLGSAPDVHVQLVGDVAPRHASVEAEASGAVLLRALTDAPVLVNGRQVVRSLLVDGDRITLGGCDLSFRNDPVPGDAGRQGGELS